MTPTSDRNRARLKAGRFLGGLCLAVGIVTTMWANQLWATTINPDPSTAGQIFAAIPPLLMAGCIELLLLVRVEPTWTGRARFTLTLFVGLCVAIISFRHMHQVALQFGEPRLNAVLYPLGVDGAVLVSSLVLHHCSTKLAGLPDRRPRPSPTAEKGAPPPSDDVEKPELALVSTTDKDDKVSKAWMLKTQGLTNAQIAAQMSVSERSVTRYLNEAKS